MEDGEEKKTQLIRFSVDQNDDNTMQQISVLSLTILILLSVGLLLGLGFVIMYKVQQNPSKYIFKTNLCSHQPMSIVSSSPTSRFNRVVSRVGKVLSENHTKCEGDHHLTSASNKYIPKGGQISNIPTTNRCQKVLIATSGRNGVVENKSICSTKVVNNSRSSNSLAFSNCTETTEEEEEDVALPKHVLLNPN